MINYVIMFIGIIVVLSSFMFIFLDRLKGEDIYFNLDVKEQEVKKVMEDAEELIAELNYTSDAVVKQIEDKINTLKVGNEGYKSLDNDAEKNNVKNINFKDYIYKRPDNYGEKNAETENKSSMQEIHINDKNADVLRYHDEGRSVDEIAKVMNIGKGEVQLIISLKGESKKDG